MCLVKKSIFPKLTLKNKVVYKIAYFETIPDEYATPFRNCQIILNQEYKGKWFLSNLINSLFSSEIHDGYIHSVKDLESAKLYTNRYSFCEPVYILKAVIPRYTFYWEGKDNDIASRRIKYIDKICKIHGNREEIYPCGMT